MAAENGWILLQDTTWTGYEKIPGYIPVPPENAGFQSA